MILASLDSFVLRQFWATEAALSMVMLAYNLMSVFRHAVIRRTSQQTLATLHHIQTFAITLQYVDAVGKLTVNHLNTPRWYNNLLFF